MDARDRKWWHGPASDPRAWVLAAGLLALLTHECGARPAESQAVLVDSDIMRALQAQTEATKWVAREVNQLNRSVQDAARRCGR